MLVWLAGCSSVQSPPLHMEPASVETVEYYPFQVKGYQNTYPRRRIVVAQVIDAPDYKDATGIGNLLYKRTLLFN